jgi:hypothetical protein
MVRLGRAHPAVRLVARFSQLKETNLRAMRKNRHSPGEDPSLPIGRRRGKRKAVHDRQGGQADGLAVDADDQQTKASRLGFMRGEIDLPDDFDRMGQVEIAEMFGGRS